MAVLTLGIKRRSNNAMSNGMTSSGKMRLPIVVNWPMKSSWQLSPIIENNSGASTATDMLLNIENVATRAMLPPSIDVMTGAAVAVGQKTHINVACATVGLNGNNAK